LAGKGGGKKKKKKKKEKDDLGAGEEKGLNLTAAPPPVTKKKWGHDSGVRKSGSTRLCCELGCNLRKEKGEKRKRDYAVRGEKVPLPFAEGTGPHT